MPMSRFALLIAGVIAAAGLTIAALLWLLPHGTAPGPWLAIPLGAALLVRFLWK
ncbi:MAG: Protein of unknown function (DUF2892) [Rhodobacteraceae bacterium HLUCCA08]|nr:MAG: Protein of unknown function (DUF2892) [Rhodobacteraceae bacterium HLUCCA08]